ncbi:MAG TPA: hypothetical protein VMZ33_04875 [Candidatus Limnocylindrales bacterium]|nr:hypothetical protein [Candidatus Limnocylindrales bacterium]
MSNRRIALAGAGIVSAFATFSAFSVVRWFLTDQGHLPFASGSHLIDSFRGEIAVALVAVGVAVGITALGIRRRLDVPTKIAAAVAVLLSSGAALAVYPSTTNAELWVLEGNSGQPRWHLDLGVQLVYGVRRETRDALVLQVGTRPEHTCSFELLALTVDLRRHRIASRRSLPTFYANEADLPPSPQPLNPSRYRVTQSKPATVCSE